MPAPFDPRALAPSTDGELYHVTVQGFPADHFRVESIHGKETISEPWSFDVAATVESAADEDIERLALGQRACLVWDVGKGERAFYGVVAAVRLERVHEAGTRRVQYHLRIVPRLWLRKRRKRTRIYQQMRVPEIIDAVLHEAGIGARSRLLREHPVREYCTQYEESDLRFIQRLCAESGIYFHFPQGGQLEPGSGGDAPVPGDTVILGDDASFYPPIGGDDPSVLADAPTATSAAAGGDAPTIHFLEMEQTSTAKTDKITHFAARTVVKASAAAFRDYDPERPMARHGGTAASTQPFPAPDAPADGSVATFAPAPDASLEVYDHHGPFLFPRWEWASAEAPLILRQKRRRASLAHGEGGAPDLAAAHRFALADHPAAHLDRAWVVTTVEHRGHNRADGHHRPYWNTFTVVPAEVTFVPPRPKRKAVQVMLTATVVGPAGEEIHVDGSGQIKVQFHWDREGGYDEKSSCWMRTMHPWSGASWGVQMIPRVGMEVVVFFEGGDPDKPFVLGALYNGTHPPPFLLPADKTRSGFKTQTSPGRETHYSGKNYTPTPRPYEQSGQWNDLKILPWAAATTPHARVALKGAITRPGAAALSDGTCAGAH